MALVGVSIAAWSALTAQFAVGHPIAAGNLGLSVYELFFHTGGFGHRAHLDPTLEPDCYLKRCAHPGVGGDPVNLFRSCLSKSNNEEKMEHIHTLQVNVTRQDDSRALAEARSHQVVLNIKKGCGEGGFTAAETLMAALGACMLTNVNAIGEKMHLKIDEARIEFNAERRDEPAALTRISYLLILKSPEPREKLVELHELCLKWGTVTNTLINGLNPQGKLVIESELNL